MLGARGTINPSLIPETTGGGDMTELTEKHCKACEGGVDVLDANRVQALLTQVPGWQLSADRLSINRRFEFKGFYKTMAFINAMAWIANQEGHHPDFCGGYNFCEVNFTTHDIGGLSENDFICAARLNALLED
jgi:4a-hydroxytetrahydrobiopterin dehydratase